MNKAKQPHTDDDSWGAHAPVYDRLFAPLTGYIARSLLAVAETRTPDNARVLDIACGSGALLIPAIERLARARAAGGSGEVVGCDFSAGMLKEAERKAKVAGAGDLFRCDREDGQALTYDDASFDAVFSCFGIFLFEDRLAGWREAARVLAPGGLFATTTWMAPEHNEMFRVQFAPVMEALPKRLTEDMQPAGWMTVADAAKLRAEVEQAGLTDVEVRPFRAEFVLPSPSVAWDTMLDNPAGGVLLRQCDEAELAAVKSSFHEAVAAHAGGAERPVVVEASCNLLIAHKG